MKIVFVLLSLLISIQCFAETEIGKIVVIHEAVAIGEDTLVFFSNGKVLKIAQSDSDVLRDLQRYQETDEWLKIKTDKSRFITSIEVHPMPIQDFTLSKSLPDPNYVPSVLSSLEWATKYFKESRYNPKDSQCFNRAHVWTYEWHKKHKFNSSKIFLFFTQKYIRMHNFHWWFHVAPYVHVYIDRKIRERVMDVKYTSGPTPVKDWIRKFIRLPEPGCLTVNTFSDYANFPENGNCYIMKASMYYYWPLDLENEELHGTMKASWVEEEVKISYEEAFDIIR